MARRMEAVVFLPGQSAELVRELDRYQLSCALISAKSEEEVREGLRSATILISTPVSPMAVESAGELKWIQSLSAGVEGWLNSAPPEIPITRMTGVYERYMAEYVFAHLLFDTQRLKELAEAQASRIWEPVTTRTISGLTLGVAGLGHIGMAVARLALAFGMNVRGLRRTSSRPPDEASVALFYFDRSQLSDFLTGLDVLVLTLPATPETDGMFGSREFKKLTRGATVINVGRGQAVDEMALVAALREGQVGRAVIDTFRHEPLLANSHIWEAPNITVTPHMAGAVYPDELARVIVPNIQSFLVGRIPEPVLNRRVGY